MKAFVATTAVLVSGWLVAFSLSGCGAKRETSDAPAANLPTVRVDVQTVESKTRTMTEEVVGTVRAKLHATLEAKLNGRIEKMPVVLGDTVRKGQLIAELDAAEIAARLEQARGSLEQADNDWKRISGLFEQQSATRSEYDAAQARQRVAKGAVAEAEAMMGYARLVAPFDALVTKKWADVGDLAVPGKPLVDLEDPALLQLEADVPEAIASRMQRDSRLRVRVDAVSNEVTGVVSEIAPAADPVSRTFRVKLDLPATPGLRSGQFARLAVPIGERASVRVPATAVVRRGQLEMVFAVHNQHAELHLVKTGRQVGDEIEILSGLEAGHAVITSGADQLTDGQPVEAK